MECGEYTITRMLEKPAIIALDGLSHHVVVAQTGRRASHRVVRPIGESSPRYP